MKKETVKEIIIAGGIIAVTLLASLSQTIVYGLQTPELAEFSFAHNYLEDYFYYLHIMRQGFDGAWLATSRMTPDIFPGQVVNMWLLGLGHIARILGISLPFMYTFSRALGGLFVLIMSYAMIRAIFEERFKRYIALLFICFGGYFWLVSTSGIEIPYLTRAWTELDPLFRLSYIPHHLWSKVFFLLILYMIATIKKFSVAKILCIVVGTILMGFSSPIVIAIFVPLVCLYLLFEFVQSRKKTTLISPAFLISYLAIFITVLVAFHHRLVQYSVFPWTGSYIAWENYMRYPISLLSFSETLGPLLLFFILAIPQLYRGSRITRLLLSWGVIGFILLFVVSGFIPLSNSRYLGGYYFIPIGIGGAYGVWIVSVWLSRLLKLRVVQLARFITGSVLLYSVVGLYGAWSLHAQYIQENSQNIQVYIAKNLQESFVWLNKQDLSVVLAPYDVSTMIPSFTSQRVIAGHSLMSLENEKRKTEIENFYPFLMSPTEAKNFFETYGISYIYGDARDSRTKDYFMKMSMAPLFITDSVVVYGFK